MGGCFVAGKRRGGFCRCNKTLATPTRTVWQVVSFLVRVPHLKTLGFILLKYFYYFTVLCGKIRVALRHSSRKSNAPHTYQCQCAASSFVQTTIDGCQRLGLLSRAQMSVHAIADGCCADTVRQSALEVDSCRTIAPGGCADTVRQSALD